MLVYCSALVTTPVGRSGVIYNEMEKQTRIRGFSIIRHWSGISFFMLKVI